MIQGEKYLICDIRNRVNMKYKSKWNEKECRSSCSFTVLISMLFFLSNNMVLFALSHYKCCETYCRVMENTSHNEYA